METNQIMFSGVSPDDFLKKIIEAVSEVFKKEQASQLQEKLLDVSAACKVFQPAISRQTLTTWAGQGIVPVQKIGGKNYFKYSDLISAGKTLKKYKRK